jgi:ubiquinone/menaquinone biosynthesis C-methylase UbiE
MVTDRKSRVCPVERAGSLDSRLRRWVQNPRKILAPYVREGMVALDMGCGPGFFSVEMAQMVGESGRVIAADLQEGMLERLGKKIEGTRLAGHITLHRCEEDGLGLSDPVDFALAFYMVHEVPDQARFFREIASTLKAGGKLLIVEPPLHVSRRAFEDTLASAEGAGLKVFERPSVLFSKAALLQKV